jgi:dTDP-4-amino-4,6-dideoxygalactose transaminase
MQEALALLGGEKAIRRDPGDLFDWPIVTPEDEAVVLDVLRRRAMSGTNVTRKFEEEFAAWQGCRYALGFNNGTASIHAALFGCGIGAGDEVICPSVTYWASAVPVYSLGGTVAFADIDPDTLCIDPGDIERCIGRRTKAIIVVHYLGHPADMDSIMAIARKHGLKVLEDVSHAQGGLYKGRKLGSIGDVGAMSMMTGKSLAVGEAGMMVTDNREIYERALAFGHYSRYTKDNIQTESLKPYAGLPLGGYKYRMHQMSAAMGRVQLARYDERCVEIRRAMNEFWDRLEGVPGLRAHRVDEKTGSNMAGWYAPHGLYRAEELGGLSVTRFAQAVRAEGFGCIPGCNNALHTHSLFQTCDVYGEGKPTRVARAVRDVRALDRDLPVSERIGTVTYSIPWFKHNRSEFIEEYANAFRKAALNYEKLLLDDPGDPLQLGGWHFFNTK